MKKLLITALLISISTLSVAADRLKSEELKSLLVGNTEYGVYTNKGDQLKYWEFYRPDGVIRATEDKYGAYTGTYKIKADGCFDADYDGDTFDGCYYYVHLKDDQYSITSPKGDVSTVTVTKGDVKKLNQF
jgi:hypothetical protein